MLVGNVCFSMHLTDNRSLLHIITLVKTLFSLAIGKIEKIEFYLS